MDGGPKGVRKMSNSTSSLGDRLRERKSPSSRVFAGGDDDGSDGDFGGGGQNRRSALSPLQRNTTFFLGVLLMLCGGTPYMVSLFTHVLKSRLGYSETEAMLVETCTHVGLYCGITQGIVYDKWGLRAEGVLASMLLVVGYVGIFQCTDGLSRPSPAAVGFLFFLVGQASHGFYTMAAMTNIRNFSTSNKGKVMGVLAAMFALSGAVFTPIAGAFGLRTSSGSGNLTEAYACNPAHASEEEAEGEYGSPGPIYYFLFVALVTGSVGLLSAFLMRREDTELQNEEDTTPLMQELLPVVDDGVASRGDFGNEYQFDGKGGKKVMLEPGAEEVPVIDVYGFDLLTDVRFLLLFVCMAIEDGTAVMFSNGLSSMRGAAHLENPGLPPVSTLLILFALGSCFGRAFWGFVADRFCDHRSAVLLCTMIGMFFSHLMMVVAPAELVAGTLLISFCFGGMFAIAPVICAEQFGADHFGTNWGCVVFAPAIGSVAFSSMFGREYEERTAAGCENCEGTHCYRETFVITTACLAAGVLLNIALVAKVKDAAVGVKVGGLIPIIAPRPPPIFTHENIEQKLFQFD